MKEQTFINQLGFERAVDINSPMSGLQREVIEQVKNFGIDKVYFCQGENEHESYPAVFIKKIQFFDEQTLKDIARVHKNAWNYKKILFLYVYNDSEIRIYNCVETPVFEHKGVNYEKELKNKELTVCKQTEKEKLEKLCHIFSSIAIDTGLIWTAEEAIETRKKIDTRRRIDYYIVESLARVADELKDELEIDLIHRLVLRSLFLVYLEDRGATDKNFYAKIQRGATSYFDILKDVGATYKLFRILENRFNGNVFYVKRSEIKKVKKEHLNKISKCLISGYYNPCQEELFPDGRLFDFSIIQIELLSQIYESFLSRVDSKQKNVLGIYYTPTSLVELILNEKLSVDAKEKQYNFKVLDPACGSGIFLVNSFKRLVRRYENAHNIEKLTDFDILKSLLINNIFGIENDSNAIKVAAFSLYLALVDCLDPKTIWQNRRLPNLINDSDDKTLTIQGKNLYRTDTIKENKEIETIKFDLVVGNPPFGTQNLLPSISDYCQKYKFAKEMVLPFLHKATKFAPNGEIAMIFNTKVLTNTGSTYENFRKWLFQECYVEKIYNFSILRNPTNKFGGRLFNDAVGPISIVFYRKYSPTNPSNRIVYYAPKTYVKSNVLEGIVIDSTDVKFLPREECQKPDTKIWKIAMWGGMADFHLINKINNQVVSDLKSYFCQQNSKWIYKTGLHGERKKQDFIPKRIIKTDAIERYYTNKNAIQTNNEYYRNIDEKLFRPPYVALKKGRKDIRITASLITHNAYCKNGVYVINNSNKNSIGIKKLLVSFINSDIATYYLFLTASSWGIEREQVFLTEYLMLPFLFDDVDLKPLTDSFDILTTELQKDFPNDICVNEMMKNVNNELWKLTNMSSYDRILVNDLLTYNLDLFEKQQKSQALFPVLDTKPYAEMLCYELNEFLENETLFANATTYKVGHHNPLCVVKISFGKKRKPLISSKENVDKELKNIDQYLWEKKAGSIYFRKKLNHYDGDDIFIIRPNQRRFWSQSMAMEDASDIILDILNTGD